MRLKLFRTGPVVAIGALLGVVPGACGDHVEINRSAISGSGGSAANGSGGSSADGSGGSAASGTGGNTVILDGGPPNPDGSGTDARIDPDAGCAASTVSGDLKPANLLFVIDKSGSMNCNLPEHGQTTAECVNFPDKLYPDQPSKWELTEVALTDAFDALLARGLDIRVGLSLFPQGDSLCGVSSTPDVPIAPLDAAQNASIQTFLAGVDPNGETPMAGATILAYAHLFDQLRSGALPGNSFVVLLSDGFETCKTDEVDKLLAQDVPNANEQLGIRTFVIGAPGSEDARFLLSQIAFAGGTPADPACVHDASPPDAGDCHFDMTESANFAEDLAAALEAISGTVLTCELDVPTNPSGGGVDIDKINVDVNDDPYSPTDCSVDGNSGWQYTDDFTRIILCGEACDAAQQENASVSIVLGCPTRPPE